MATTGLAGLRAPGLGSGLGPGFGFGFSSPLRPSGFLPTAGGIFGMFFLDWGGEVCSILTIANTRFDMRYIPRDTLGICSWSKGCGMHGGGGGVSEGQKGPLRHVFRGVYVAIWMS